LNIIAMRKINEIIVHCAATREGRDFTVEDITRWHKARGFATIGYHYVIYRDGSIHEGRPLEQIGAHCVGHNKHSIGVCYIGGCASDGKTPKDTRTSEQKEALLSLLRRLKARFPNATIHGHRDFAAKACPSYDAFREYRQLAIAIMLVFSSLLFSSCRSTKRVVKEKAEVAMQQTVSQSATSFATDKFLQNIVLQIDSIVLTSMSVPQVSENVDGAVLIGRTSDSSGLKPCARETRTRESSLRSAGNGSSLRAVLKGASLRSGAGKALPRIDVSKIKVSGIRLQSVTADSSSSTTAVSSEGNLQASGRSLAKAKEAKKPSTLAFYWIVFLIIIAIAVAVAFAIASKANPFRSAVRFILRLRD
jgi:N-acetylmuramoyl-L-alanine amidase